MNKFLVMLGAATFGCAIAIAIPSDMAFGDIVLAPANWAVHNGSSTFVGVSGATDSPAFNPADDQLTIMSPFTEVTLDDGDFITLSATLTLGTRTGGVTGNVNSLNTQLRVGLFNGPDGAVGPNDAPNHGIIIEYSNAGGLLRAQKSDTEPNPFLNIPAGNNIANAMHTGGSIQGANPTPINIELTLTRNGSLLDISGEISGDDGATPYSSVYQFTGYDPSGVGFTFNRVGFHFGNNVNSTAGDTMLTNVLVTTSVPESSWGMAVIAITCGAGAAGWRRFRTAGV